MEVSIEVDKDGNWTLKTEPKGSKLIKTRKKFDKKKTKKTDWLKHNVYRHSQMIDGSPPKEQKFCHLVIYSVKDLDLQDGSKLKPEDIEAYCECDCEDKSQTCTQTGAGSKNPRTIQCVCPVDDKKINYRRGGFTRIDYILDQNIANVRDAIATTAQSIEDARAALAAKTVVLDEIKEKRSSTTEQIERAQDDLEHASDRLGEAMENERAYALLLTQFEAARAETDLRAGVRVALQRAQDDARNWKDEEAHAEQDISEAKHALEAVGRERRLLLKNTQDSALVSKAESDYRGAQSLRNRAARRKESVATWSRQFSATVGQWQRLAHDADQAAVPAAQSSTGGSVPVLKATEPDVLG